MEIQLFSYLILFFGVINLFRMAMFLVGSDLYGLIQARQRKRNSVLTPYLPTVLVVIPAHNESYTVLRSIKSVAASTYPRHLLKMVVVDDGSGDDTPHIVERYIHDHQEIPIAMIKRENAGKARALNLGMQAVHFGELVMCLDADSALEPTAVQKAVEHFRDTRVAALAANVKITRRPGFLNLIQYYEYLICYQMKRAESLFDIEYIIGGIGSTFRRSVLEKVGYYDTDTVTEDIDLTMKVIKLGNKQHKIAYGDDVIVHTEGVLDVAGLIRQRFRWKWGRCQTFLKNLEMFFSKDGRYTKGLTWFYLPFAIFGDISYFFEPFLFGYILYVSFYYLNPLPLFGAGCVMTAYVLLNVWAEDSLSFKKRLVLSLWAPVMYFSFYVLSIVEYVALIQTFIKLPNLSKSLLADSCGWVHVQRPKLAGEEAA